MPKARILVVDDEVGMLEVYSDTLHILDDVRVFTESNSEKAARRLETESFDLLLTDIRMPGMTGVELLRHGREFDPELPVLMITAFPSVETAVEAMKLGAVDYITKPFMPDNLLVTVRRLLDERKLRQENRLLRRQVERSFDFEEIIGASPAMQSVFATIERIAPSDADVLILGETGTGKELVARSIHQRSLRKDQRFVPVDCGAIPENLMESELFGYERGAFTGADARNIGLLEFTNGGSFFMDEVGELPLHLQAKLLRVLQERKVRRIGGKEEINLDLRVIAATRRDVGEAVREGRFREDLYFRINVIQIELPPLRKRGEDVLLLAEHFLKLHTQNNDSHVLRISDASKAALMRYRWPGNVRELQNVIRRGIAICQGAVIEVDDLPSHVASCGSKAPQPDSFDPNQSFFELREHYIAEFEEAFLIEQLKQTSGDVSAAARRSQIPRGTFYRLMKKYNIQAQEYRV